MEHCTKRSFLKWQKSEVEINNFVENGFTNLIQKFNLSGIC